MSDQGRDPPAYLEYAAAMMARRDYRLARLSARGLLYTLRLELWANKSLPADPEALAQILGLDADEVAAALAPIMPFFAVESGEIRCPELDRYRAHLDARHLRQAEGGRQGAALTNAERTKRRRAKKPAAQEIRNSAATATATPTGEATTTPAASGRVLNTIQPKPNQSNPPSVKGLSATDPWVIEYEAAPSLKCTAEAYRKASNGE